MKRLTALLFIFCTTFYSCTKNEEQGTSVAQTTDAPVLELVDGNTFDFGTVTEGDIVEHTFNFRNAGNQPLVISNITSSCGCTTPEWPRDPIAPNGVSNIIVRFNTINKVGSQAKSIAIYANTNPVNTDLVLRGNVNEMKKQQDSL